MIYHLDDLPCSNDQTKNGLKTKFVFVTFGYCW